MSLKDGLSKKEGFTPEASSPAEVKRPGNSRPKYDDKMVKRTVRGGKKK